LRLEAVRDLRPGAVFAWVAIAVVVALTVGWGLLAYDAHVVHVDEDLNLYERVAFSHGSIVKSDTGDVSRLLANDKPDDWLYIRDESCGNGHAYTLGYKDQQLREWTQDHDGCQGYGNFEDTAINFSAHRGCSNKQGDTFWGCGPGSWHGAAAVLSVGLLVMWGLGHRLRRGTL
jgi:hypothetical protein